MIAAGGMAAVLGLYWDDAWHTDVGRDDFFSRSHLLLYAGVAVLLAVAVTPVMEFETDVPQFPVALYWPVLVGMLDFAFALIRRLSVRRDTSRRQIAMVTTVAVVGSHLAAHAWQPAGLSFGPGELALGSVADPAAKPTTSRRPSSVTPTVEFTRHHRLEPDMSRHTAAVETSWPWGVRGGRSNRTVPRSRCLSS